MNEDVTNMPSFQPCGERRAHPAHTFTDDATASRCPGIQSVSEQSQAVEDLVRRYAREHRLAMALTDDLG